MEETECDRSSLPTTGHLDHGDGTNTGEGANGKILIATSISNKRSFEISDKYIRSPWDETGGERDTTHEGNSVWDEGGCRGTAGSIVCNVLG